MKFDIVELTNPLTADILAQKDFQFTSGGSGGSGGVVIKPSGNILADGLTVNAPAVDADDAVILATFNMNLVGNRKLFAIATVGPLNYVSAPLAESTLQIWVGGVLLTEIENPAGNLTSIITFQGVQGVTPAGITAIELRLVNGPVALGVVKATLSVMEFSEV